MPFVMQTWTASLPMMQQTVLLENTRGPDTIAKYHPSKFLLRWYRRCILISAPFYARGSNSRIQTPERTNPRMVAFGLYAASERHALEAGKRS